MVAPAATATTGAAATTAAPESAGNELRRAEVAAKANELGYKVEVRGDKKFYCRTAAPLGTRFEKKECLSEATFAESVRQLQQNSQQPRGACQGQGCVAR
jgi:hypothetical protein